MAEALQRDPQPRHDCAGLSQGMFPVPGQAHVQRAPATEAAATTDVDEQALVRQWAAESGPNENELTNRVYFRRHPEAAGVPLRPGSPEAAEWVQIRQTVVRTALAKPPEQLAGSAQTTAAATDDQDEKTGDPLSDAMKAGADLIDFALESGGEVIDAVADFFGVGREVVEAGDLQTPATVVDVPTEPDAAAHQRGDTFKDQRDNKSAHVEGSASCSPTSFTMALIDLHGGDEAAVRSRTIELLKERKGNTEYGQTEELVIELLQVVDWPTATAEKPAYFWSPKEWAAWAKKKYGGNYYKDPNAQQYVASLYSATGGGAAEVYSNLYNKEQWAPVITALDAGAVAAAQGGFTGSGHVVDIVSADDTGVTINDPYGLWIKGKSYQITNGGAKVPALSSADREILVRRATKNPELSELYDRSQTESPAPGEGFGAWGKHNFYSWSDVDTVKLGLWISVLRGK